MAEQSRQIKEDNEAVEKTGRTQAHNRLRARTNKNSLGSEALPVRKNARLDTKIEELDNLASAIVSTTQDLKIYARTIESPSFEEPVDFYSTVRNFEILLIQRALRVTGGSQAKAARLLKMNATTLNTKIKGYEIQIT